LLFLIIGILLGIITGLIPGLHSNTVGSALSGMGMDGMEGALLIVGMFAANEIFSFVPAIFLGIPDESVTLSVLPGQRMVKAGKGIDALKVMCISAFLAVLLSVALFPIAQWLYPIVYYTIRPYLLYVLAVASAVLVLRGRKPAYSALIFLLAGLVGKVALDSQMPDPFLPLFVGMFAISAMLTFQKQEIPEQREGPIKFNLLPYVAGGVLLGWAADLLPGISSPAQVAAFASLLVPFGTAAYLSIIAAIGMSESVFAFATAATLGKARVGSVAQAAGMVDISGALPMLLAAFLIAAAAAAAIIYLGRGLAKRAGHVQMGDIYKMLMAYLVLLALLLDGLPGLLVLVPSVAVGLLCLKVGAERTSLMGAIIIPTIMLLAGL